MNKECDCQQSHSLFFNPYNLCMDHYIFLTDEGYIFQPDSEGELREIENLQVIRSAQGADADEAYRNLLSENS